jgi:transposase InsO family protein
MIWKWTKRAKHRGTETFRDKPRKPKESKITPEIEEFILFLRIVFEWGTGRIQNGLISLPEFMYDVLPKELRSVSSVHLSRSTINNLLKKHKRNGYKCHKENWKFFRAKKPNELWQLDLKGPVTLFGKEYYFLVCIDDYSRYLLVLVQFDHCPTTEEIGNASKPEVEKYHPESILTDNGGQFRELWRKWCSENNVIPLFAHPYYPQDKGKVERAIRNVAEEFTNLLSRFPQWLDGQTNEFKRWYNEERFHRGVKTTPITLFR